jgi:hypothetical protein
MVILINGMPAPGSSGGAPAETKLWLPEVIGGGGGNPQTYTTQFGIAYKQDKLVHAWFEVRSDGLASILGFWTFITGLPYPISNAQYGYSAVSNKLGQCAGVDVTFTEIGIMAYSPDVNKLRLMSRSPSGTTGYLPPTAITDPVGFFFQGWISYLTD